MQSKTNLINRICSLLISLYILSYWVLPRTWSVKNKIDGSWIYALGKLRTLGLSLGKDCWFTYGPASHWFGPSIGLERYQFWPYYLVGFFIASLYYVGLKKFLDQTFASLPLKAFFLTLFVITLSMNNNNLEAYLVMATLLTFSSGYLCDGWKTSIFINLMLLAVFGILFKFSFGILASVSFFIALIHGTATHRLKRKHLVAFCVAFPCILYVLFAVTSGTLDILTYLLLGLEVTSKYSEVMIYHTDYPHIYIYGVMFALGGLLIGYFAARGLSRSTVVAFMLSLLAAIFLLFKHGHVRTQSHIQLYYTQLAPYFVLLLMIAFVRLRSAGDYKKFPFLLVAIVLTLISFTQMMSAMSVRYYGIADSFAQSWITIGSRFAEGLHGQDIGVKTRNAVLLKERYGPLIDFLNDRCRTLAKSGKVPTISFYPFEMSIAEGVEGGRLLPTPGLQLYACGPHTRIQQREVKFLEAATRPDIVLIGSGTLDNRNPVNDYTNILRSLYRHYKVKGIFLINPNEHYIVLESDIQGRDNGFGDIISTERPQGGKGQFLHIQLGALDRNHEIAWRLATFFFKAPELTVRILILDENNQYVPIEFRGNLTQLQKGVYFDTSGIVGLISRTFTRSDNVLEYQDNMILSSDLPVSIGIVNASAVLLRDAGAWNLPVLPAMLPLKVRYCSFTRK